MRHRDLMNAVYVLCAIACATAAGRAAGATNLCDSYYLTTILSDAASSKSIIYAKLENTSKEPGPHGVSVFRIVTILKSDASIESRKTLTVNRHIKAEDSKNLTHYLLLGDIDKKGQPDIFWGKPCSESLLAYVRGLLAIDHKDRVKLLKYCFDYLHHSEEAIAKDARGEFAKVKDSDWRTLAKNFDAAKLRLWLNDRTTSSYDLDLYGLLLGHCGVPDDAALLRQIVNTNAESKQLRYQLLSGYVILAPTDAWSRVTAMMKNPNSEFVTRIAILLCTRYFRNDHLNVISEEQILGIMKLAISQADIADIAIEDLRQWKCWKLSSQIFAVIEKKDYDTAMMRLSIVRYALCCPDEAAKKYVAQQRAIKKVFVEEVENDLKFEDSPVMK